VPVFIPPGTGCPVISPGTELRWGCVTRLHTVSCGLDNRTPFPRKEGTGSDSPSHLPTEKQADGARTCNAAQYLGDECAELYLHASCTSICRGALTEDAFRVEGHERGGAGSYRPEMAQHIQNIESSM
jgi:hypothetical protein